MPVCELVSKKSTPGFPAKELTITIESVNVPVPRLATLTVATPVLIKEVLKGLTFAVSPVSVTVTCASVNDTPPKVPVALVVSVYVIGSALTGLTEQNNTAAQIAAQVAVFIVSCPRIQILNAWVPDRDIPIHILDLQEEHES
jgi:hypothetical protein